MGNFVTKSICHSVRLRFRANDEVLKTNADISAESLIASPRIIFYDSFCPQNFPFRHSLMVYITMNPSSTKIYQKIIQTCKYFFHKNPILIVPSSYFGNCDNNGWCVRFNYSLNQSAIDMKNITSKIWITNLMIIRHAKKSFADQGFDFSIIPRIYQCDVKELRVFNQNISFNDFIFLTSNCKTMYLFHAAITNDNGHSVVALEKLVQILPKLVNFQYTLPYSPSNIITSETAHELLRLPHFLNFDIIHLYHVPETFGIENLFTYMKENKKTEFRIDFLAEISEKCKQRLQKIVDEIVLTESHDYRVPMIYFPRIILESEHKLFQFWARRYIGKA